MMRTSRFLVSDDNIILPFALGVGLSICLTRMCYGLTIVSMSFWYMAGGIVLQVCLLILISFSKITDPDVSRSLLESDS